MAHRKGAKPLRPRGERRPKTVKVNLTVEEKARVLKLADDAGLSEAAWLYSQIAPQLLDAHLPEQHQDPLPFPTTTE